MSSCHPPSPIQPPCAQRRCQGLCFLGRWLSGSLLQWKPIAGSQATRSSRLLCSFPKHRFEIGSYGASARVACQEHWDLRPGITVVAEICQVLIRSRHLACLYLIPASQQAWKGMLLWPTCLKGENKNKLSTVASQDGKTFHAGYWKHSVSITRPPDSGRSCNETFPLVSRSAGKKQGLWWCWVL